MSNHQKITITLCIFLLCLLAFFSFLPVLKNGFVNWDDDGYILNNPLIRQLNLSSLKKIFFSFHLGLYKPLVLLSFAIEYHFFKLNPFIYHLDNLLLHLLNACLVFWFIYRLSLKLPVAFLTALFFASHPLRVESVAWATERKDMLYGLFLLFSLISYLYYLEKHSSSRYLLSLFLFFLSLLAKPSAVGFPFLLLAFDYFKKRPYRHRLLIEKAPFLALSLLALITIIFAQRSSAESILDKSSFGPRNLFLACYNFFFYLKKTLLPFKLSCLYPFDLKTNAILPKDLFLSLSLLCLIALAVSFSLRYSRKVAFAVLFYFFTLLPVSQIIPTGGFIAADRYSYIPSVAISYLFSEAIFWVYRRHQQLKPMLFTAIALSISLFAFLTYQRTQVWRDSLTLWNDCLKNYPHAALAYNNRGNAYQGRGDFSQALSDYNHALKLKPDYAEAYNNRGAVYQAEGNFTQAIADYNQAIRLNYADGYYNRGFAYQETGNFTQALSDYNHALKLKPDYALAYNNRGIVYQKIGKFTLALSDYHKAIELDPNFSLAYNNRGNLYHDTGNFTQALSDYNHALKLKPDYAEAYNNRGNLFREEDNLNQAIAGYNQALKLKPELAEAYYNRGNLFREDGNLTQALSDYSKAIELKPDYAGAYNNRAVAYFLLKDYAAALSDVQQAERLGSSVNADFLLQVRQALAQEEQD